MLRLLSKITLVVGFLLPMAAMAQSDALDLSLLARQDLSQEVYEKRPVNFTKNKDASAFAKYNPVSLTMGTLMFGYQKVVSPQISAQCMYNPSCSRFSQALIGEFGIFKGTFLSADRLMRCNQLGALDVHYANRDQKTGLVNESATRYRMRGHDHDHADDHHDHDHPEL